MSLARFDIERALQFIKRDLLSEIERSLRPVLIEKLGVGEGSRVLNEIIADTTSALQVDVSKYRSVAEYLEALKTTLLGSAYILKLLTIAKKDARLVDTLKEVLSRVRAEAPSGNISGLIDSLIELSESLGPIGEDVLVSAAFEYLSTVLKSLSFRDLTEAERELAKRMILSILRTSEMPIVPITFVHKKLGLRVNEKEVRKLLEDIAAHYPEIILLPGDYITTKEKLDSLVAQIADLARMIDKLTPELARKHLGLDLPSAVYNKLFEVAEVKHSDLVYRKKLFHKYLTLRAKIPEIAVQDMVKAVGEEIERVRGIL